MTALTRPMTGAARWFCAALFLSGCFNSSSSTPVITVAGARTGSTSMEVQGVFFSASTIVFWNGKPQITHGQSDTKVTVDLDPGLTDVAGTAQLTAQNDGSFLSPAYTIFVIDAPLTLTDLSPRQGALGAASATVTLSGTGFRPTSQVLWNDAPLEATFVNSTTMTATVPAPCLGVAGDGFVQVAEPACKGGYSCTQLSNVVAFNVGPSTRKVVGLGRISDIAWDATQAQLFAALYGDQTGAGSIQALDPVTAALGASATATYNPRLSISDQDQFLYASDWNADAAVRYSLPGLTARTSLSQPFSGVGQMAAAPGAPATVAILYGFSLAVVDDTTLRSKTASTSLTAITWGLDASTLYGFLQFSPGVTRFQVDQTGVVSSSRLGSTQFAPTSRLYFDRAIRRLYGDAGENVDEQGIDSRPFSLPADSRGIPAPCTAAIDGVNGKAFFACIEYAIGGLTVRSFDVASQQPIARILLQIPYGDTPSRIVRWGSSGLAVAAGTSVYLYDGPFVH